MNNKILSLARLTTRILLIGDIFLASILILLMIAWQIDVGYFENIYVLSDSGIFKFSTSPKIAGVPLTPLSAYGSFYFYFLVFRALLVTGVLFLILQTILKVIRSIGNLDTFRSENVKSFRKMGNLFLVWFALAIPTITGLGGQVSLTMGLYFNYAVWALICFVLAEIFSEGNKLMEDNKLTI